MKHRRLVSFQDNETKITRRLYEIMFITMHSLFLDNHMIRGAWTI
jgi:hypothetical protein